MTAKNNNNNYNNNNNNNSNNNNDDDVIMIKVITLNLKRQWKGQLYLMIVMYIYLLKEL